MQSRKGRVTSPPDHDVLQQVMCTHDAEKLAIAVLEIYDGGYDEELTSK